MVVMLTRFFGEKKSINEGLAIWPYAVFAGLCFIIPYLLVSILLGPEFPSLLGSLFGLSVLIPLTKAGFLAPKDVWDFPEKDKWEKNWMGSIAIKEDVNFAKVSLFKAWTPYILIGLLLVLTRVNFLPFKAWVASAKYVSSGLFGTSVVTDFDPLNIAGIMPFLFIALICIPLFQLNKKQVNTAWSEALKRVKGPCLALIFAVPLVRLMMHSDVNPNDYLSMPVAMAQSMVQIFDIGWPLTDTFIGALGAFISGSNTVSNMLFALFQYSSAESLGISHIIGVSLQNTGGALGNMICVHNIIAACATVGLAGVEGLLIKRNLIPMSVAAIIAGLVGLLLLSFIVPGLF
jgi:lactate permease